MSASTKRKSAPAPRRPKPVLVKTEAAPKPKKPAAAEKSPVRPVVGESSLFLLDMEHRARDVAGEINLIDASEARSQADFDQRVATERDRFDNWLLAETSARQAEHDGQMSRRDELQRIHDGCWAAIGAAREEQPTTSEQEGERT